MLFWNLMKRELNKYDAKLIEQGRTEGIEQGRTEGIEQGRTEAYQQIAEWNARRLEAAAKGIPFDEPPPTQNGDQPNP